MRLLRTEAEALKAINELKNEEKSFRLGLLKFITIYDDDIDLLSKAFLKQQIYGENLLEVFMLCPEIKIDSLRGTVCVHPVKKRLLALIVETHHFDKNKKLDYLRIIQSAELQQYFFELLTKKSKGHQL